jgi:transcriptional regulator with XRE-family HTH domain
MTIGENIRRIRKEKGLTQKQLGELCGINEANIRKYELGKANPKVQTVDKIARALGVDTIKIIEDLSYEQYKKTDSYQQSVRKSKAKDGLTSILDYIYGGIKRKETTSSTYWFINAKEKNIVLRDNDINKLFEYLKVSLPYLVEFIGRESIDSSLLNLFLTPEEELETKKTEQIIQKKVNEYYSLLDTLQEQVDRIQSAALGLRQTNPQENEEPLKQDTPPTGKE